MQKSQVLSGGDQVMTTPGEAKVFRFCIVNIGKQKSIIFR